MRFNVYVEGELVGSSGNIITDKGHGGLLKYVARKTRNWAGAISLGIGDTSAQASDRFLDFEVNRQSIETSEVDITNNIIRFKSTFPQSLMMNIREYGLHTLVENTEADGESRMIASFDPDREGFDGNTTTNNVRVGTSALLLNNGENFQYDDFQINLDKYQSSDKFIIAGMGQGDVEIRFKRNSSNYFSITKSIPSSYSIVEMLKSSFTETGNVDWEDIRQIEFLCNSGSVMLDAFSVRDTDEYDEYFMVSRAVESNPIDKPMGRELSVEYEVELTVE